jgi:hypothetical protein
MIRQLPNINENVTVFKKKFPHSTEQGRADCWPWSNGAGVSTVLYELAAIYNSYKAKLYYLFLLTYNASTSAVHYQPHYLFVLKGKASTSAVHCHSPQ